MSLSRMRATTLRWLAMPPWRAAVTHFSATGRKALALASVVTSDSAAINDATRLPIMDFWCADEPPNRRPRFGVACMELSPSCAATARARPGAGPLRLPTSDRSW